MAKRPVITTETVERLLRRYLGNGVSVTINPTGTTLSFSYRGMGTVAVEATDDGLVIHEPVEAPAPKLP